MTGPLAIAVIAASLALAALAGLTALLDRRAGRLHEAGAALVETCLLGLTLVTLASVVDGERPAEPAVFAGYLIATLALLPVAVVLARMEPTRWGAAILGGAALIIPVLIVRLQQVYG